MKRFDLTTCTLSVLSCVACLPLAGQAGDALIFPTTARRTNANPTEVTKPIKEVELDISKVTPLDPGLMDRGSYNVPRDIRAERRAKNARLEAKEWITFDKGELSARDAENGEFGIREDGAPRSEEEHLLEKAERAERAGQPRLSSKLSRLPSSRMEAQKAPPPGRSSGELNDWDKKESGSSQDTLKPLAPKQESMARDMDLRSLLTPGKANSLAPPEKTAVTWQDIFGGNRSSRSAEEPTAQRQESTEGLRGPTTTPSTVQRASAPPPNALSFRNDFATRPPETLPPAGSEKTERSLGNLNPSRNSIAPQPPAPGMDFNRPIGGAQATTIHDPLGRANGFSPLAPSPSLPGYGPAYGQPPQAPARSGSGFNTIPTRPGYGR